MIAQGTQTNPVPYSRSDIIAVWVVIAIALLIQALIAHWFGKLGRRLGFSYWLFFAVAFFFGVPGYLILGGIYINSSFSGVGGKRARRKTRFHKKQEPDPYADYVDPQPIDLITSTPQKPCPHCGAAVSDWDETCWNCGMAFSQLSSDKICPTCNNKIPFDTVTCPYCGSPADSFSHWR